ncbi:MAG: hypothetical protein AAF433_17060 [Bacteroidota bacterium]
MRTTLLLYGCFLLSCQAQTSATQFELPSFKSVDEVMEELLSLDLSDLPATSYLELSRRPDGYYLGHKSMDRQAVTAEPQLWQAHGQDSFIYLGFPKSDNPSANDNSPTQRQFHYKKALMDNRLYWNYPASTQDAIQALTQLDSLSDQEVEFLARAYSDAIYERISIEQVLGNPEPAVAFDLRAGRKLSEEQLEEINELYEKSTALFRQLPPDYPLSVGSPDTKATNEEIDAYLKLMQYHSREAALDWIRPDRYDPLLLFWARALLESCAPDALLFTYGDNDTYPLLYLQEAEGLRTDVAVINAALLNLPRYCQTLAAPVSFPGGPIRFSSTDEQRQSWAGQVLMLRTDEVDSSPKDWLRSLSKLTPANDFQAGNSVDWPSAKFLLSSDSEHFLRMRKSSYSLSDITIMDLIATNYGQRPICAATTLNFDYFPFSASWQQLGLIKELKTAPQSQKYDLRGSLDWWQSLSPQTYQFSPSGTQTDPYLIRAGELILRLCNLSLTEDQRAEMAQMLQCFSDQLPPEVLFQDYAYYHLLVKMEELGFPIPYIRERAEILVNNLETRVSEGRFVMHQLSLSQELLRRLKQ